VNKLSNICTDVHSSVRVVRGWGKVQPPPVLLPTPQFMSVPRAWGSGTTFPTIASSPRIISQHTTLQYFQAYLWDTWSCKYWLDCIDSTVNCRRLSTVYINGLGLQPWNPRHELVLVSGSRANRLASLISV